MDVRTVADVNAAGIGRPPGTCKSDESEVVDLNEFSVDDLCTVTEHSAAVNDHISTGSTCNGQKLAFGSGAVDAQLLGVDSGTDQDRIAGTRTSDSGVDLCEGFGRAAAVIGVVAFGGNMPDAGSFVSGQSFQRAGVFFALG